MNCHLSKTLIFWNQSKECETVKDNVQHQISLIKLEYFIWLLRLVPPKMWWCFTEFRLEGWYRIPGTYFWNRLLILKSIQFFKNTILAVVLKLVKPSRLLRKASNNMKPNANRSCIMFYAGIMINSLLALL